MSYALNHIARVIHSRTNGISATPIEHLLLDSRRIHSPADSLFFALKGARRDGHQFIADLYKKGVRCFVISEKIEQTNYPDAEFLTVGDTLEALQQLAAFHRQQFNIPVIGITGSNGKTIVKEWLFQLLHEEYNIVRSPKSYNSQIGVPLSVWQMNGQHTLAIFEAGISRPGEMEKLERIIQPTIGVLTHIGEAHSEGFASLAEKETEKRILFKNATVPPPLFVREIKQQGKNTRIVATPTKDSKEPISIDIPFTDHASVENAITCWQVLLMLGYDNSLIQNRMMKLVPVNMRLELKKGINHCSLINDSYSADIDSLEIALNFLDQQSKGTKKTVILSDLLQTGMPEPALYNNVLERLRKHKIKRLVAIGENITRAFRHLLSGKPGELTVELYPSTDEFTRSFLSSSFREETILIKGARVFAFERIAQLLEQKAHQTVLEINLAAIVHNLKEYQRLLRPSTRIMAMVKAFAYGSGGAEIAGILQYHKIDYLGVAYADEGVELRNAGIHLPVMVMNPEENAFDKIVDHNLEPELYSFDSFNSFDNFLKREGIRQYPVHIEIETGMNRLGFSTEDMAKLGAAIRGTSSLRVQSVFTHLAASEEASQDEFTRLQFRKFEQAATQLKEQTGYGCLQHVANSGAVARHPDMQLNMIRLGIGLYGVDSAASGKLHLQTVATLRSTIAQLKHLRAGESVSYNRKSVVKKDSVIATIRLGYADGYPRRLGNGVGKVWIKDRLVPVIGTVCMDMFMADVSGIEGVKEGDEVIIFGSRLPVQDLAAWAGTIPYEIMTGISQRVKRVYFEE